MVVPIVHLRIKSIVILAALLLAVGCEIDQEPDTALDCGREFIMATYNGNFKRARKLIVANASNNDLLYNQYELPFRSKEGFAKQELSESPLVVKNIHTESNGSLKIIFDNAITQILDSIVVISEEEKWRVALDKK